MRRYAYMHVLSTNMHFHHTASGESHYNCVKGFILPIAELELSVQFELELWHCLATSFSKSHEKNISALAQCHDLFKRPIKKKSKAFGHGESLKKGPYVF